MSEFFSMFGIKHIPQDITGEYHVSCFSTAEELIAEAHELESDSVILETPSQTLADDWLTRNLRGGTVLYPGRHPGRFHNFNLLQNNRICTVCFESDTPWNRAVVDYLLKAVSSFLQGDLMQFRDPALRETISPVRSTNDYVVGIIGAGTVGERFGLNSRTILPNSRILYHSRHEKPGLSEVGAGLVLMDALMREADFVIASLPLTEDTHHLIGEKQLMAMKPGALFINISAGGVVKDADVVETLSRRGDLTAIIDTSESERDAWAHSAYRVQEVDNLVESGRLCLTGHTAYKSRSSTRDLVYAITRPALNGNSEGLLEVNIPGEYNGPYILKIL